MNSRAKGKRGELDARDAVRECWWSDCMRSAQANGKHSADLLNVLPGTHVEVKRRARISALKYLRQAEKEAGPTIPFVLMREDGETEWTLMVRLKKSPELAYQIVKQLALL